MLFLKLQDGGVIGVVPALGGGFMVQGISETLENRRAAERGELRVKRTEDGLAPTLYLRSSVLGGQVVAEIVWASVSWQWNRSYVYLGSQLLAVQSGVANWIHEDPVTKSKRVTNSAGAIVSTVETDPWGADTPRSSNVAFQPKKFTSYERDANGSDEAMFRRYNRWHSRFDQPDPSDGSYDSTDPQSFNRYAYVQNDPVNNTDPTGLFCPARGCDPDPEPQPDYSALWSLFLSGRDLVNRLRLRPLDPPQRERGQPPQNTAQPQAQQRQACDPGFFDQNQNFTISGDPNNRSFTGSDLNFAARVVFAESSSLTSGLGDQINRERNAIASVLYNRIGAVGFPDRTARATFEQVARAPGAFASIGGAKLNSSAAGQYQNLQEAAVNSRGQVYGGDCNDVRSSVDAIRRLVNFGSQYGYTQFRAGTRGQGTVIGGSRFW